MSSPQPLGPSSAAGMAAAAELRRRCAGQVHTTPLRRWLYSTDASGYRVVPDAVLVAGSVDDLVVAAEVAARHGVSLVPRGAGTSLAGQAIGPGILIDCFKLDRILAVDPDRRTARVQPGVIQASLNRAASRDGLELGPDTSTVDQATIAGMVGNNSSGSRSIIYGESIDKVVSVEAALVDGSVLRLGSCPSGSLASGVRGGARAALAAALEGIRSRSRQAIATGYPQTRRCTSGYHLSCLLDERPNLAKLLAGSEGTLALFLELEVALDPVPARRVGAALTFPTLRQSLEANVAILETRPSAVEVVDLGPMRGAPNLRLYRRLASLLTGDEQVLLTVEYQGTHDEAFEGLGRLRRIVPDLGASQVAYLEEAAALAEAGALRRAALPLLMGVPGAERPASFVEDTAVAPERLADFADAFREIVTRHGARASFTGHASAGCLHVRPLLDQKSAAGVGKLEAIARDVGGLVSEYHGAISGEHGCGRSRSWFLPGLFGEQLYGEFRALKDAFDPRHLLNPGIIVDGPAVTEDLRFGADYRTVAGWRPRLAYDAEGGFDLAVERCFGAGQCKKTTGTMCPPATVSRDEAQSTRGRANALQALISGAIDLAEISSDEMEEVLGTCLACKACKTECPAGVDMAALKAEWLAERHAREGTPLLARVVADIRRSFRLAGPFAPLIDLVGRTPLRAAVMRAAGVAPQRPLPQLARRSLTARVRRGPARADVGGREAAARRDGDPAGHGAAPGVSSVSPALAPSPPGLSPALPAGYMGPPVVLFADCFTQYQEPEIGEAFLALLSAAGVPAEVVDVGCCGRTMLSTGSIEKARRAARHALDGLWEQVTAGREVAFVEPSCLAMVHDDWRRLLPGDSRVAAVAAASRFALSVVADVSATGQLRFRPGGAALLHPHCHERALFTTAESERALGMVSGLDLTVLDEGCCGMSGIFGYQAEHYDLSVAIAEKGLLPAVRAAGPEVAVLATGTSCRTQIRDLSPHTAQHPLVFLAGRVLRDVAADGVVPDGA